MNPVTYPSMDSAAPPGCGPAEAEVASDTELILALQAARLEDLAGVERILARYELSLEDETGQWSKRRCAAFLRDASTVGLIDDGQGLTLREYVAAPLCLPEYVKALVSAVGTRIAGEGATSVEAVPAPN